MDIVIDLSLVIQKGMMLQMWPLVEMKNSGLVDMNDDAVGNCHLFYWHSDETITATCQNVILCNETLSGADAAAVGVPVV